MSEPTPKDYTSTLLRMAGNIAAGMTTDLHYGNVPVVDEKAPQIARAALTIAREILKQATGASHAG